MKNFKATKLTKQAMKKVMGGNDSSPNPNGPPQRGGKGNDFVRPNVEKPVFRQEFGQQMGNNR
ncbi:hypothetical protein BKI52_04310 [marine bacterium AO1-C]|nr:hypothetical protein BKI52_04310 [marine bacterium AO1-C]